MDPEVRPPPHLSLIRFFYVHRQSFWVGFCGVLMLPIIIRIVVNFLRLQENIMIESMLPARGI